jgi:nitroreductase
MIQSAIEAIKLRTSVRSYQGRELETQALQALRDLCREPRRGPFGNAVRFALISLNEAEKSELKQLGTYGMIRGASWYLAAAVAVAPGAMEDLGCIMEDAVIRCTQLGLGTCWLGGSFNRAGFAKTIGLKEHEVLPCVTPVGYAADKRGLMDRMVRTMAGSKHRKPWGELFFENDFSHPLAADQDQRQHEVLQCVRIAPSASNKQPWRIVKDQKGTLHLYLARTRGYGRWIPGVDLQRIDIGIAMSHIVLAAQEIGLKGSWQQVRPSIDAGGREYVISWIPTR